MRTISRAALVAVLGSIALIPPAAEAAQPSIWPDGYVAVDAGTSHRLTPTGESARLMGNGHIDDDGGPTGRA